MSENATKVADVGMPLDVTGILQVCLPMSEQEQQKYLALLQERNPQLREEVDAVLRTGQHAAVSHKMFLSALIDIAQTNPKTTANKKPQKFVPMQVGKYLILKELGRGGMAEVYRGKSRGIRGFERPVAIKKIISEYGEEEQFRSMFEFEARLSANLHHPNIVQVFDFFSYDGCFYLVMEFVDGRNLSELISRLNDCGLTLPIESAINILCEALKGLEYAHGAVDPNTGKKMGIVHRDVSPRNVMVTFGGDIKLVDFGIAKARERVDITNSGTFRGTVSYMSPEVVLGGEADRRTDIFSAGLLLFEMITGKPLFKADSVLATLDLIRRCEVQPHIEKLNVANELKDILTKALTKDPNERYQTAEHFQTELQKFLHLKYPPISNKKLSFILNSLYKTDIETDKRELKKAQRQLEDPHSGTETHEIRRNASDFASKLRSFAEVTAIILVISLTGYFGYAYFTKNKVETTEAKTEVKEERKPATQVPETPKTQTATNINNPVNQTPEAVKKSNSVEVLSVGKRSAASIGQCSTLLQTTPQGANIRLNGNLLGKSPLVTEVPCGVAVKVSTRADGYIDIDREIIVKKSGSNVTLKLEPLKK